MKKTLSILVAAVMLLGMMAMGASAQSFYDIPMAVAAPTLDGVLDPAEWANAAMISFENADELNWVVDAADSKFGPGSTLLFMWDADYLYVGAAIRDLTVAASNPEAGGALNAGDGVQLCFFSSDSAANGQGDTNMFWDFLPWTGEGRNPATAESYEHFNFADTTTNVKLVSSIDDKGYAMEIAIPWSDFAAAADNGYEVKYEPVAGTKIIMECVVMDQDEAGQQSLAYLTDEWCVPATTDVFTLSAATAGTAPVVEEAPADAPADEAPVDVIAPAPVAPATADAGIVVAAVVMAAAAAVVVSKKH
ncbi:MAG: hypothetical protein MJ175_05640 [Clostridia bacterium]|nr:hypothetical protein [Clostridia bacterium]